MKASRRQNEHTTDLLFILSLFCVFAASSVLVITFGANVYQSTVSRMEDNYTTRFSLSYIANQVRQHDQSQCVTLMPWDAAEQALVLYDGPESSYATVIYYYDGALRELYCDLDSGLGAADGLPIVELAALDMTLDRGALQVEATAPDGKASALTLALRSAEMGGERR